MDEPNPEEMIELTPDAIKVLEAYYDNMLEQRMEALHNRFVAFVSEAGIPLNLVLVVLEILVDETKGQIKAHYMGE